jgi:hypothetical protein
MKKIILLIITLIGIMSWQSCQYEWLDPIDPEVPDVVSFSVNIQPIFDRSCNNAGCHASGGTSPDLTPANAYADLFAENMIDLATPENSILYKKCASGGSMNKYTEPGDPDIILKWIQQGALNN